MVKPKGIWLHTTQLGDLEEAKVVTEPQQPLPRAPVASSKKIEGASRKRAPVVTLALVLCCIALFGLVSVYAYSAFAMTNADKQIALDIDGEIQEVTTQQETVQALFEELGIVLGETDTLDVPLTGELTDGMRICIEAGYHSVLIRADGKEYLAASKPQTVAEALQQVGVALSAMDELSHAPETPITGNTVIDVVRVYTKTITEEIEIPPTTSRVEDTSIAAGTSKVLKEGEPGIQENIIRLTYRGDEETNREVIDSRVVKEPGVSQVAYGVAALASRSGGGGSVTEDGETFTVTTSGGTTFTYSQKLTVESTAYTWTGNRTATGVWPTEGQIAVDPRVIPLGTKVYVEGYGFATATDTGGAIKGNIVDVYFDTYDECISWGRKHGLTLYIVE